MSYVPLQALGDTAWPISWGLAPEEAGLIGPLAQEIKGKIQLLNTRLKTLKETAPAGVDWAAYNLIVLDFNALWTNFEDILKPYVPTGTWDRITDAITGAGISKSLQVAWVAPAIYKQLRAVETGLILLTGRYNKLLPQNVAPLDMKPLPKPARELSLVRVALWSAVILGGAYVVGQSLPGILKAFKGKKSARSAA